MSAVDEFADFVGSVPYRAVTLPWGEAQVWDLGTGDPVVLLHGISSSRRVFFRVAPRLAERFRVVVPQLRGEDVPARRVGYEDHAADLAALLEALDLRGATLFGFSFGGAVALAYGARRDPRVARIVVQGTFPRFRLRALDRAIVVLSHAVPAPLAARYYAYRVRRGPESRLIAQHAPGVEVLDADWAAKTPMPTLRARIRMIDRTDLAPAIAAIDVPLALAHGRLDKVVPFAFFERLRALRPDALATVWDDVGHVAVLTHPERVAELVGAGR